MREINPREISQLIPVLEKPEDLIDLYSGGPHVCSVPRYVNMALPPLTCYSVDMREDLAEKILPYWYDTTLDRTNGGYTLSDHLQEKRTATEKQIVTQSRLMWTFSHVHLKGYSTAERNYLKAAEYGYRFLIDKFLDKKNGGYFWTTDLSGKVLNDRKIVYGEAFALFGLVEYYRAANDKEALRHSTELYGLLQQHAYDKKNSGWTEHFTRDWKPILQPTQEAVVGVAGYKSANTHLHLMEALTELYKVTRDNEVRQSLNEAVRLNATYFYPKEAGRSCVHRQSDWKEVSGPKCSGLQQMLRAVRRIGKIRWSSTRKSFSQDAWSSILSYGHNVEFAWLMIRAQKVLGTPPAWDHFYQLLNHALKYGYDHERGGLYSCGEGDNPASQTDKVWWSQAEMLAALTDALKAGWNPEYETALKKLLDFVAHFMTDPSDGVWLDTVTAEGRAKRAGKAHNWKENYHDVRAMVKFIETFPAN